MGIGIFSIPGLENAGLAPSCVGLSIEGRGISSMGKLCMLGISGLESAGMSNISGLVKGLVISGLLDIFGLGRFGMFDISGIDDSSAVEGRIMLGVSCIGLRGKTDPVGKVGYDVVESVGRCGSKFNCANLSSSSSSTELANDCSAKSDVKNGP